MSKTKKQHWIYKDRYGIHLSIEDWKPEWKHSVHHRIFFQMGDKNIGSVSPQLQKMWRLALKGKRGKAAICEVDGETWVPIIEIKCPSQRCNIRAQKGWQRDCVLCDDTGKTKHLMTEDDL